MKKIIFLSLLAQFHIGLAQQKYSTTIPVINNEELRKSLYTYECDLKILQAFQSFSRYMLIECKIHKRKTEWLRFCYYDTLSKVIKSIELDSNSIALGFDKDCIYSMKKNEVEILNISTDKKTRITQSRLYLEAYNSIANRSNDYYDIKIHKTSFALVSQTKGQWKLLTVGYDSKGHESFKNEFSDELIKERTKVFWLNDTLIATSSTVIESGFEEPINKILIWSIKSGNRYAFNYGDYVASDIFDIKISSNKSYLLTHEYGVGFSISQMQKPLEKGLENLIRVGHQDSYRDLKLLNERTYLGVRWGTTYHKDYHPIEIISIK